MPNSADCEAQLRSDTYLAVAQNSNATPLLSAAPLFRLMGQQPIETEECGRFASITGWVNGTSFWGRLCSTLSTSRWLVFLVAGNSRRPWPFHTDFLWDFLCALTEGPPF